MKRPTKKMPPCRCPAVNPWGIGARPDLCTGKDCPCELHYATAKEAMQARGTRSQSIARQHRKANRCSSLWQANLWARCSAQKGHAGSHQARGRTSAVTWFVVQWGRVTAATPW